MLHDISKGDAMRSLPKPNTNDDVSNRLAHGTTQNHNAKEVAVSDGLKFKERQILVVQDGVNKAVFGFMESTNRFGFRIAADGLDALDPGPLDRGGLIFDDQRPNLKVLKSGVIHLDHIANAQISFSRGYPEGYYSVPNAAIIPETQDISPLLFVQVYADTASFLTGIQIPYTHLLANAAGAITEHAELTIQGAGVNSGNVLIKLTTSPIATNIYYTSAYTLTMQYWFCAIQPTLIPFQ